MVTLSVCGIFSNQWCPPHGGTVISVCPTCLGDEVLPHIYVPVQVLYIRVDISMASQLAIMLPPSSKHLHVCISDRQDFEEPTFLKINKSGLIRYTYLFLLFKVKVIPGNPYNGEVLIKDRCYIWGYRRNLSVSTNVFLILKN